METQCKQMMILKDQYDKLVKIVKFAAKHHKDQMYVSQWQNHFKSA